MKILFVLLMLSGCGPDFVVTCYHKDKLVIRKVSNWVSFRSSSSGDGKFDRCIIEAPSEK